MKNLIVASLFALSTAAFAQGGAPTSPTVNNKVTPPAKKESDVDGCKAKGLKGKDLKKCIKAAKKG